MNFLLSFGYSFIFLILCTKSESNFDKLNTNVCSYTSRSYFFVDDLSIGERNDEAVYKCCHGWTRHGGNREGSAACLIPMCTKGCGEGEACIWPETCICTTGTHGCSSTIGGDKISRGLAALRREWLQSSKQLRTYNSRIDGHDRSHPSASNTTKCTVELPQDATKHCKAKRQKELQHNRLIYKIRSIPKYNDSTRNPDRLLMPFWDMNPRKALGIAFTDKMEGPWIKQYLTIAVTNTHLRKKYLSLTNKLKAPVPHYDQMYLFFYNYHIKQKNVRVNISNLIVTKWKQDKVFAEQQLAGMNPFQLKRLIDDPCPRGWKAIRENCYRIYFTRTYNSYALADRICEFKAATLPQFSNAKEAADVNNQFKFLDSPVYVNSNNGKWPDGSSIVDASNSPRLSRKCLAATFAKSGMALRYRACTTLHTAVLCQKEANIYGIKISELKRELNPSFNWRDAIESKLESDSPFYRNTMEAAIQDARIYVATFPELNNLRPSPDINDKPGDNRTMVPVHSPIAIFISNPDINDGEFLPVAIQLNNSKASPVYTPEDGDNFLIAKILVQSASSTIGQMVEHLVRTHLIMDPLCTASKRHLPIQHPIGQLNRQHCNGLLTANKVAESLLLPPRGKADRALTTGFHGNNDMMNNAYSTWSFKMHNPIYRLKTLGLNNKISLPYFPYRDDGKLLYKALHAFASDYVNLYYSKNKDVGNDIELQRWANEIALGATGSVSSGKGKVRDFPKSFRTKTQLIKMLTKFIWTASGQHAAVNFPTTSYFGLVPNMPGKFYDVNGVHGYNPIRFPTKKDALFQTELSFDLGSLHYDSLFDYGKNMADIHARELVSDYKDLMKNIEQKMIDRNEMDLANGHLYYNYLYPSNVPNSINT